MLPPESWQDLIRQFGNPADYVQPDGTLSPAWERLYIRRIDLPEPLRLDLVPGVAKEPLVTKVTCHVLLTGRLMEVLEAVHERGLWEGLGGYSGGFQARRQRGGNRASLHTWGLAWDFGASRDPLGDKPGGGDPDMPIEIVKIWEAHEFTWGGRWARPDQMHFQWGRNV